MKKKKFLKVNCFFLTMLHEKDMEDLFLQNYQDSIHH